MLNYIVSLYKHYFDIYIYIHSDTDSDMLFGPKGMHMAVVGSVWGVLLATLDLEWPERATDYQVSSDVVAPSPSRAQRHNYVQEDVML